MRHTLKKRHPFLGFLEFKFTGVLQFFLRSLATLFPQHGCHRAAESWEHPARLCPPHSRRSAEAAGTNHLVKTTANPVLQAPSPGPPRVQPSGFCHVPDSVPGAGNQQGVNQTRGPALRGVDDRWSTAPSSQSTSPLADSCPVGLQVPSAMSLPGGDLASRACSRTF